MFRTRDLAYLKNVGNENAGRLTEVGIYSEDNLRRFAAVSAYNLIKEKHWNEISGQRKPQLRAQVG